MTEERDRKPLRVAAVGDLHCTRASGGAFSPWLRAVNERADVLLLAGDLTDYGTAEEAEILLKELSVVRVPILAVLGNHDHESGHADVVFELLTRGGVRVLGGDAISHEIEGVGFTGVKGFCGGFASRTLGHWGEPAIKAFVQECIDETLRLETGLARLRTERKVVLLHYSPVRGTLEGEPLEIFPFLGCSRLEGPMLRYRPDLVLHGHVHRGCLEGATENGVPVFNVALPLLARSFPDHPPFRVFEV